MAELPKTPSLYKPQENSIDPSQYETKLNVEDEAKFQTWIDEQYKYGSIGKGDYNFYQQKGFGYEYDYRAAFLSKPTQDSKSGHWNDIGKKPNHSTFSNHSKYAKDRPDLAGSWNGDEYIPPKRKN